MARSMAGWPDVSNERVLQTSCRPSPSVSVKERKSAEPAWNDGMYARLRLSEHATEDV